MTTDLATRDHAAIAQLCERVDAVRGEITRLIEAGNAPSTAAGIAGVPKRTWSLWRQKAEQGVEPYVSLLDDVERALATFEGILVDKLANPPKGPDGRADHAEVKATQFLLERTRRERFGQRLEVQMKVTETMQGFFQELQKRMSPEAFNELVMAMAQMRNEQECEG
jgi:hypothetical protein